MMADLADYMAHAELREPTRGAESVVLR